MMRDDDGIDVDVDAIANAAVDVSPRRDLEPPALHPGVPNPLPLLFAIARRGILRLISARVVPLHIRCVAPKPAVKECISRRGSDNQLD